MIASKTVLFINPHKSACFISEKEYIEHIGRQTQQEAAMTTKYYAQRLACIVWPHLPVCVIGAIYKYHRAHRVLVK